MPSDAQTIDTFRSFVVGAQQLTRDRADIDDFSAFVRDSELKLLGPIKEVLPHLLRSIRTLCRWCHEPSVDLLQIAGISGREDSYTELIRWCLSPDDNPHIAGPLQQEWLEMLGISQNKETVEPRTQYQTADGIPDLVLVRSDCLVIVEAKVWTGEHPAPSGQPQTVAYPDAALKRIKRVVPVFMVYLTPWGSKDENPQAINTTWLTFCLALARTLDRIRTDGDRTMACRQIITHLLGHATPASLNFHALAAQMRDADSRDVSDNLRSNIAELETLWQLLEVLQ